MNNIHVMTTVFGDYLAHRAAKGTAGGHHDHRTIPRHRICLTHTQKPWAFLAWHRHHTRGTTNCITDFQQW